ncbi:hypothetical protein D3C75_1074050 [compost metagenome]
MVIPLSGELPEEVLVVNGTLLTRLVLELDRDAGQRRVIIRDCQGNAVSQVLAAMGKGIHVLEVPVAGVIAVQAVVT